MTENTKPTQGFQNLGICEKLLGTIANQKFTEPTPIQAKVIPIAIGGADVVGIAQTGTGKTLAFGVPTIQKLMELGRGQALVLCPTRELAVQVDEMLQKVGRSIGLRTAVVIGGASAKLQLQILGKRPHIVIATPGRLSDFLQSRNFSLNEMKVIILDEADRMLDIGFMPQIRQILAQAPKDRQTMLFSATMPAEIAEIANKFMKTPVKIEVAPQGTVAENIDQEIFIIGRDAKTQLLDKILSETKGSVLVFSRTKHGAKKIAKNIQFMGHTATDMHSNKSFAQRKLALSGFKTGRYRVLVATDIAARGIDVSNIELVINYDIPDDLGDYVHRIGRTGRAGKSGKAISFVAPDQKYEIKNIERLIRKIIKISPVPTNLPEKREAPNAEADRPYSNGRSSYGRAPQRSSQPRFASRNDFAPRSNSNFASRSNNSFAPRSNDNYAPRSNSASRPFANRRPSTASKSFEEMPLVPGNRRAPYRATSDVSSGGSTWKANKIGRTARPVRSNTFRKQQSFS